MRAPASLAAMLVSVTGLAAQANKPAAQRAPKAAAHRPAAHAAPAARPTVAFTGSGKVTASTLNLRAEPNAHARDIGDVRRGSKLTLTGRTKDRFQEDSTGASYWYRTQVHGRTGWLWGGYLVVHAAKPPRPASQTSGRPTQWIEGTGYSMLNGLNLRAGPTTAARDIGDLKYGQKLSIHARTIARYSEDHRGSYRWYEVTFGNKRGWVFGAYVRFHAPPPPASGGGGSGNVAGYPGYHAARGQQLAAAAYRRGNTHPTVGYCLKGVEEALQSSIFHGFRYWMNSAHDFGVYAEGHHADLAKHGLRVENNPPGVSRTFPKGTIMVFSRGRCGFNARWGHIEVVVDHDTACSDHCRRRNDEWCGPSTILYPTAK